jgi:hypothetical protein
MSIARVLLISLIGLAGCMTMGDDSSPRTSSAPQALEAEGLGGGACFASFCPADGECPPCANHTAACVNNTCTYTAIGGGGGGGGGGTCPQGRCVDDSNCVCKTGSGTCVGGVCQY